jgi:serpin B
VADPAEPPDWLQSALRPLGTPTRPHHWATVEELQRRGRRRRQERIALLSGATSVILVVALLAATGVFNGRGRPPAANTPLSAGIRLVSLPFGATRLVAEVSRRPSASSATVDAVTADEEAFALQLTKLELAANPSGNVLLSPMSADIDLSMLELGSAGATTQQIAAALHTSGISAARQAAAWEVLTGSMLAGESTGELHVANSIWVQQRLHVEASFLRQVAAAFGNQTYQVNFASNSATQAINAWVDAQTAGRIKRLFQPGQLDPMTEVVLANALHFHAAWRSPLLRDAVTVEAPFHPASGGSISVPTIEDSQDSLAFAQTSSYQAVEIPYSNGRFAALLVEPETGSVSSLLESLDGSGLSPVVSALKTGPVDLSMPKLTLSVDHSLARPLEAMGMAPAFVSADFAPMLGPGGATNQAIGLVQQAATLHVNEWGTDAAAATGISVIPTDARAATPMDFDHPYVFLIRDAKTGAILFSSVVNDPTAG